MSFLSPPSANPNPDPSLSDEIDVSLRLPTQCTGIQEHTCFPTWNELFTFSPIDDPSCYVLFTVKDRVRVGLLPDEPIAYCTLPLSYLLDQVTPALTLTPPLPLFPTLILAPNPYPLNPTPYPYHYSYPYPYPLSCPYPYPYPYPYLPRPTTVSHCSFGYRNISRLFTGHGTVNCHLTAC